MSERAANKIIAGLEDALKFAECGHDDRDFVVIHMHDMGDGRARVRSRCEKCGGTLTTYTELGAVEFVNVHIQ